MYHLQHLLHRDRNCSSAALPYDHILQTAAPYQSMQMLTLPSPSLQCTKASFSEIVNFWGQQSFVYVIQRWLERENTPRELTFMYSNELCVSAWLARLRRYFPYLWERRGMTFCFQCDFGEASTDQEIWGLCSTASRYIKKFPKKKCL